MLLLSSFLSSTTSQSVRAYCDRQSDLLLMYFFFLSSLINCVWTEWSEVSSHRTTLPERAEHLLTPPPVFREASRLHFACSFRIPPMFSPRHSHHPSAECGNRKQEEVRLCKVRGTSRRTEANKGPRYKKAG